jgi:nucleotide-binding universal stress UspA family protein
MFKTIVWATDGSEAADAALPFAKGLAEGEGHELVVVHSTELLRGRAGGYPDVRRRGRAPPRSAARLTSSARRDST